MLALVLAPPPSPPPLLPGRSTAAGCAAWLDNRNVIGCLNWCCRSWTPASASRRRDAAYCWSRLQGKQGKQEAVFVGGGGGGKEQQSAVQTALLFLT